MLDKQHNQISLKDPALSALLRDALSHDKALSDAPGRTDRIMRKVMAVAMRPTAQPRRWNLFAWVGGSFATAAIVVALTINLALYTMPKPMMPPGGDHTAITIKPTNEREIPGSRPSNEKPRTIATTPPAKENTVPETSGLQLTPKTTNVPVESDSPVQVANALYDAGTAASYAGDYQTAYSAYEASYKINQSPDALIASGNALEELVKEDILEDAGSST